MIISDDGWCLLDYGITILKEFEDKRETRDSMEMDLDEVIDMIKLIKEKHIMEESEYDKE